ncbi:MAG: LytTR family transcriptional regulator [Bacteroidales bacterium]|nr:LytTR family transcriptional regulator [Bacteroidales bacterium]
MSELTKRPNLVDAEMKHDLKVLFSISLGIFLFVLFFQPFELNHLAFNNKLLFIAGLGAITFLVMSLFHIVLPLIWPKFFKAGYWENEPVYLISILILVFSSAAFAFYLRYVGSIELSLYIMFKIVVICIAPVVVLQIYDKNQSLRHQVYLLHENLTKLRTLLGKYEKDQVSGSVEIFAENKSEKIEIRIADLVFIRSADNYIEIVYLENEQFKKKLIRNTLRNIEDILSFYPVFIRCHRTCIVNKNFVEKMVHHYTVHKIIIKGYNGEVPVSRQYLLQVKEAIIKG